MAEDDKAKQRVERAVIFSESGKALLLLNGGAAIAVLAFAEAVYEKKPDIIRFLVVPLVMLALGALGAALVGYCRYYASFYHQTEGAGSKGYKRFRAATDVVYGISAAMYVAAIVVLAVAGYWL